jgi:hypothetical protein
LSSGANKTGPDKKLGGGLRAKALCPVEVETRPAARRGSPISERYAAIAALPAPDNLLVALRLSEAERQEIKTYGDALALNQFRAAIKGKTCHHLNTYRCAQWGPLKRGSKRLLSEPPCGCLPLSSVGSVGAGTSQPAKIRIRLAPSVVNRSAVHLVDCQRKNPIGLPGLQFAERSERAA